MRATQTFVFALLQHGVMAARSTIAIAPLEIQGKTPCCVDRLTTLACSRLAATRKRYFDHQCANNADFAFVQCCASCFNKKKEGSRRDYEVAAKKLLLDPYSTTCSDRRGPVWCHKILNRESLYGTRTESAHSCKSFPFAFRECRQSCGFCSLGQNTSRLRYNYTIATDPRRCTSKIYYALEVGTFAPSTIKMPMAKNYTTKVIDEIPVVTTPTTETHKSRIILGIYSNFTIPPTEPGEQIGENVFTSDPDEYIVETTESTDMESREEEEKEMITTEKTETTTEFDPLAHLDLERRRRKHKGYFIAEITENDLSYEGPREVEPEF
ncbi:unnamed protein product, partial [Mesorhabditis belari]|uniref:ShKT domain-containing protein n=1 Tax=Mesorhabditis belari TaxID=2138241 RepID=A0AAF3ERU7_9BILA